MSEVQAFPLSWPLKKRRTPIDARVKGAFKSEASRFVRDFANVSSWRPSKPITVEIARKRLSRELDLMGAERIVLSTNIELRLDGMPKSRQTRSDEDPGAALYFEYQRRAIVLACDRFTTVGANIAAIAYHIEGMRRAERHGVGTLEEMFTGFMALPPALAPFDWRELLSDPRTLEEAEGHYKSWMLQHHPDKGGDDAKAAAMNAAIAEARRVLK